MRIRWAAKSLMVFLGGALWLAAASPPGPAARADDLMCTPEHAGRLSCQAGIRCSCKYFSKSLSTGTPAGYRWDCGILRAHCNGAVLGDGGLPATLPDSYRGPYPAAVTIDRSETNLTNSQSQTSTQTNTQTNK